jgi:hypothetical protein
MMEKRILLEYEREVKRLEAEGPGEGQKLAVGGDGD